jgi:hypothetical protein
MGHDFMSVEITGGEVLKPILDAIFGIGAVVMFGELIIVLYHAITYRFTPKCIIEVSICIFLFALCLDWVSGFNFFKNVVAPIIWNFLNSTEASQIPVHNLRDPF